MADKERAGVEIYPGGTPGIDLKLRSNGAAGAYALTPWTPAGLAFIQAHVLSLPSAAAGEDCVWFSDGEAGEVRSAYRESGLRLVAGNGAEPDPKHDFEGFWDM
jgi:hypothetical protein